MRFPCCKTFLACSLAATAMLCAPMYSTADESVKDQPAAVQTTAVQTTADQPVKAQPVFKDGEAQVVDAFKDSKKWIRHHLWVETEFDSDGDGRKDRMHVDVTRPEQTESQGLKVAVIYETSPFYCGTGTNDKEFFWDPQHEIGATPPKHETPPTVGQPCERPVPGEHECTTAKPRGTQSET